MKIAKYCLIGLLLATPLAQAKTAVAVFAGGCFWCIEQDYQKLDGVIDVVSGFTGGKLKNPTYNGNHQGHYEAVKVTYDTDKLSYQDMLDKFWLSIDPFDNDGQFCDKGPSYRSAIFVKDNERQLAQDSLHAVQQQFPKEIVRTEILPMSEFWPVDAYHQDYAEKNPVRYKYYRWNCGRDQRLDTIWGTSS